MPTYLNTGKNVTIVERSDGVAAPIGPGESVRTLSAITVAGFTLTDAKPAATKSKDGTQLVIRVTLVSDGSGVVAPRQITDEDVGFEYWTCGYSFLDFVIINPATGYPTKTASIKIIDEIGQLLVGESQSDQTRPDPSVVNGGYPVAKGRPVDSMMTVTVGDIGATKQFTLHIKLVKK